MANDRRDLSSFFSSFSTWLARRTGSHWAVFIGAGSVVLSLAVFGIENTNIAISIVTLLMLFILQNTQNRDSAAIHLKLDDLITNLEGPRDEVAGVEGQTEDEILSLRKEEEEELAEPTEPDGATLR
jgi:low affinity Fe/Cu permease